jgi:hypothetical protein
MQAACTGRDRPEACRGFTESPVGREQRFPNLIVEDWVGFCREEWHAQQYHRHCRSNIKKEWALGVDDRFTFASPTPPLEVLKWRMKNALELSRRQHEA